MEIQKMTSDRSSVAETNLPPIVMLNQKLTRRERRGGAFWLAWGINPAKLGLTMAITIGLGMAGAVANFYASRDLARRRAADMASERARAAMLRAARRAGTPMDGSNLPTDRAAAGDSLTMLSGANAGGLNDPSAAPPEAGSGGAGNSTDNSKTPDAKNDAQGNPQKSDGANAAGSASNGQGAGGNGANAGGLVSSHIGQLSSIGGGSHGMMNGGAGMSSGIGRGFDPLGGGAGELLAMARPANAASTKSASSRPVTVSKGGSTLERLGKMNSAMRPTANMGDLQHASQIQSDQWNSGQTPSGGGQPITGGGDSLGGLGTSGPGDAPAPNDGPGPSGSSANPSNSAPDIAQTANATPWQGMLNMAETLLMVAAGLVMLAGILGWISKLNPVIGWLWGWRLAQIVAGIAAALATAALAVGVIIMTQYGQYAQGFTLLLGAGGVMAGAAFAMMGSPTGMANLGVILGGAMGFASAWMGRQGQQRPAGS